MHYKWLNPGGDELCHRVVGSHVVFLPSPKATLRDVGDTVGGPCCRQSLSDVIIRALGKVYKPLQSVKIYSNSRVRGQGQVLV